MQNQEPQLTTRPGNSTVQGIPDPLTPVDIAPTNERPADVGASFAEPTELQPVESSFAGRPTKMAVARHNTSGTNRFGQDANGFPYCLLNMEAWREAPFDLRIARWFRSEEEALSAAGASVGPAAGTANEPTTWSARFAGGIRVELHFEEGSRWVLWVDTYGKLERRRDSATPHFEHAKRIAAHWFGDPITPWFPSAAINLKEKK